MAQKGVCLLPGLKRFETLHLFWRQPTKTSWLEVWIAQEPNLDPFKLDDRMTDAIEHFANLVILALNQRDAQPGIVRGFDRRNFARRKSFAVDRNA